MSQDQPAPAPEPAKPGSENTFFDWMRGLGIPRQPGWIGGVCAGIAARLGIDPIIVRGIAVVIAVLGGPALLLYAAAWLLLPDQYDRIHLQEAIRGNFDKAHAGIGVMVLLSFLPFAQGVTWQAAPWWIFGGNDFVFAAPSLWGLFWTLAVLGSIVWLVIWLVGRSRTTPTQTYQPASSAAGGSTPTATADDGTVSGGADTAAGEASATNTLGAVALPPAPEAPPHPATGATDADLSAWKEQQAAWKREYDAWKQQQAASERELAQQRAAEQRRLRQEQNAEQRRLRQETNAERHRAAVAEQRRTRSNPVYSLVAIGLATIAGAATALAIGETGDATAAITGMSVSLGMLGLAIIINGFRGKRSGGSSGVAFLLVIALSLTSFFSWANGPVGGKDITWSPTYSGSDPEIRRTVIGGNVTLDLTEYFAEPADAGRYHNGMVRIYVGRGDINVIVPADEFAVVDAHTFNGSIDYDEPQRPTVFGYAFGTEFFEPATDGDRLRDVYVTVWVASGDITITRATE
jgi:phage shock protein PspC (stress-responsive transcriptional regulator)